MPLHDYTCPLCGRTEEHLTPFHWYLNKFVVACPDCHVVMLLQHSASNFTVTGFNAKNGYSSK